MKETFRMTLVTLVAVLMIVSSVHAVTLASLDLHAHSPTSTNSISNSILPSTRMDANSFQDVNTTKWIDLSQYVTIEQAQVGYPAMAHWIISINNTLGVTLYNVTITVKVSFDGLPGIAPWSRTDILDFGNVTPTQTSNILAGQSESQTDGGYEGSYMPNVTLVDAYGYEDMRTLSLISIQVPTATITIGQSTNISGSITPILAGVNVTVYCGPFTDHNVTKAENWETLATVATNESGNYSYQWTPSQLGNYELKANWTGDQYTQPAETTTITLNCIMINSTISIQVSTATITIGDSINISGSINPDRAGVNVTIYYNLLTGYKPANWGIFATVTTDENGNYSYGWTPHPSQVGNYQLKANWTGDEYTKPAETSIILLDCVKIVTSISISTSSSSTVMGYSVSISGTLSDEYGDRLADEPVILYYTSYGVSTWTLITSVATDAFGNYSVMWIPSATGTFTIEATWDGNTIDGGASNNVTLSSLPYLNQYVFSVESNSTVSDLAFNTTSSELSFTVSGPSGTSGYVRLAVAKSLVANVTNLSVYVDGNQTDFTVSSTDDSWLLSFTYTHSTHIISVALGNNAVPEFPTMTIPLLLVSLAVVVILAKKKGSGRAKLSVGRKACR